MSKDIDQLINLRGARRGIVTRIHNDKDNFPNFTEIQKATKRAKLNALIKDLADLDREIQTIRFSDNGNTNELEKDVEKSDTYTDMIYECLVLLDSPPDPSRVEAARSLLKSPVAPLPKFLSREGEDLQKFFRNFEEVISKFRYPDHDKFLLLKQQISGRASKLIESLEGDKQSFDNAKDLLVQAFASPATLKFNIIKQISEIRMFHDSDPYEYISKMRVLSESVKEQKLEVDDVLNYFFWNGMNDSFKTQLTNITNKTKPSLQEINDNVFDASERYLQVVKNGTRSKRQFEYHTRNVKETSNFAVNLNVDSRQSWNCCLCTKDRGQEADHPLYKCRVYTTPKTKIDKIRSVNGCIKCASLNHTSDRCTFKFKMKCSCGGWHYRFLCLDSTGFAKRNNFSPRFVEYNQNKNTDRFVGTINNGSKPPAVNNSNKSSPKTEQVQTTKEKGKSKASETAINSVFITDTWANVIDCHSVLPTFTCRVNDSYQIRALKDLGCQSNFITDKVANSQNLKVLQEGVVFRIKGFNSNKEYHTKVVEVNLNIGCRVRTIAAICVPEIKISLDLPNLSVVVKAFIDKGYIMADSNLLNSSILSDIDLLIGTRSAHCIKHSEISFGPDTNSIYAETEIGVMLLGDIDLMIEELPKLPDLTLSQQSSSFLETGEILPRAFDNVPTVSAEDSFEIDKSFAVLETEGAVVVNPPIDLSVNLIYNDNGTINEAKLKKAAIEIMEMESNFFINYDTETYEDSCKEIDDNLIKYTFDNMNRNTEGRLVMPVMWNPKISHLLAHNKELAIAILKSSLKKLKKDKDCMKLMNDSFKEQEKMGIIERIENLDEFLQEHPEHSFIPHMGVFRMDKETTKCRVVYLSNLFQPESGKRTVSHNMAMHSGPNLNQKLSAALLQLRFDENLLIYDLKKAFNQIALRDVDANRLLCVWFRNVDKNDFSIVGYRNVRLPFGIRCAPTMLLLGLFKILVIDTQLDDEYMRDLKALLYQCFYMDNGGLTMNSCQELSKAYGYLNSIFNPYQFHIQQVATNNEVLQRQVDRDQESETPSEVKLLGSIWDRVNDTLATKPICLNESANTKRSVLQTIASQYDIYNFNGPILNRSRLYMHKLQCNRELGWDDKLSPSLQNEWKNIVKQANSSPVIKIPRKVGNRSDPYRLIACTDASKMMYGTVVFMQNLSNNEVSFVCAKNRIVNTQLESKTVPVLELHAITLGSQTLLDIYNNLSGPLCLKPINIVDLMVFSDSLVALSWINSYTNKFDKMQKRSVFAMNRISQIYKVCEVHPIKYRFINGCMNPADYITREVSYKLLTKTNYLSGPNMDSCSTTLNDDTLSFVVPSPSAVAVDLVPNDTSLRSCNVLSNDLVDNLIQEDRFSTFQRMRNAYARVLEFIHKLKVGVRARISGRFEDLSDDRDFLNEARILIIRKAQRESFPDIFKYFEEKGTSFDSIPNLVTQLNIYKDRNGLLRVSSKFERFRHSPNSRYFPLLLPRNHRITELMIRDIHIKFNHIGLYALLNEVKRTIYVPKIFSFVKKILKECIHCKKLNARTVKLNQSSYREFRVDPPNIPFRYSFLDYMGPFFTKSGTQKTKVWILIFTCMWSRAVDMKVCIDMSTKEFLRAFQMHAFEYGVPEYCISDQGTQLVAAGNKLASFLSDSDTLEYFSEVGIKPLKFEHFPKGHSQLGSMVEICVKLTKRLIHGSIRNNILDFRDFEFLVAQVVHIVNRRPVAYKECLRTSDIDNIPVPVTPEMLIKGHELNSINVIPELQGGRDLEQWIPDNPQEFIAESYAKLLRIRDQLIKMYNEEFLSTLVHQAVNEKGRYSPVTHKPLSRGDVVMIKEPNLKPFHYPMGLVKEVKLNELGEVTEAVILKGSTRELTRRHASNLIPILSGDKSEGGNNDPVRVTVPNASTVDESNRPQRQSALKAQDRLKGLITKGVV